MVPGRCQICRNGYTARHHGVKTKSEPINVALRSPPSALLDGGAQIGIPCALIIRQVASVSLVLDHH